MKQIKALEIVRETRETEMLKKHNVINTVYWAYERTQDLGYEMLTFEDIIWEDDIDQIVENLKDFEVDTIRISNTSSGLLATLSKFDKAGYPVMRMTSYINKWDQETPAIILQRKDR